MFNKNRTFLRKYMKKRCFFGDRFKGFFSLREVIGGARAALPR
jgi:hypothetical protein